MLAAYYCKSYGTYSPKDHEKHAIFKQQLQVAGCVVSVGIILAIVYDSDHLGSLASAISIMGALVPCTMFWKVYKAQDCSAFGSVEMAIANFLCFLVWGILGYRYIEKQQVGGRGWLM